MAADGNSNREGLRKLSKTLLGSRYQVEIGAAIATSGKKAIWGQDLLMALGDEAPQKGQVSTELAKLQHVGLLVPVDGKYDRRRLFRPADPDGAYWTLCQELRRSELAADFDKPA